MNPGSEHIDFEALVGLYLSGSASAKEVELLESIVKNDSEKKKAFFEIKRSWIIAATASQKFDTEKAWEKVQKSTTRETKEKIKPLYPRSTIGLIWKVAASVLILVAAAYFAFNYLQYREKTLVAEDTAIEQTLKDGTKVSLNKGSTLKYPTSFSKEERRVRIKGEGYFEVASDKEKPFIVEALDAEIHVLGTSFYVKTNIEEESLDLVVFSGKVVLVTAGKKSKELKAGDKIHYKKEQKEIETGINTDPNIISWKTQTFTFDNTSLDIVFSVVSNTYGVDIRLRDEQLKSCELTATFTERTLEDVLRIIKETFDIRYVRSDGIIWVLGDGCN